MPFGHSSEPTQPTAILADARAKIIWGDAASEVRAYLLSHNVPAAQADAKIKEFIAERNAEIRSTALRKTIIGAVLLLIAILYFYILFHGRSYYYRSQYRTGAIAALAAAYGFWNLLNGIIDLIRPQSESGSITEMSD